MAAPTTPQFTSPANNATVSGNVLIQWTPSTIPDDPTPPTDTTAPVFASASVPSAGTTVVVNLTETGSPPVLPASGVTGWTVSVNGSPRTVSSATRTGSTQITLTVASAIQSGDTVTVSYSPGNVTDSASPPNAMAATSNRSVTNNSTQGGGGGSGITRTASGLLARFDSSNPSFAFDLDDWAWNAEHLDVSIDEDGRLLVEEVSRPGTQGVAHITTVAAGSKRAVQILHDRDQISTSNWCGPVVHANPSETREKVMALASTRRSPDRFGLEEQPASGSAVWGDFVDLGSNKNGTIPYRVSVSADGKQYWGYDHTTGTRRDYDATSNGIRSSGLVGVGLGTEWTALHEFYATAGHILTVTGLPAGSSVEVRDASDNVLASAAESSGTANVDMLAVEYPSAVKVAVVQGGSDLATASPAGGVWGGDAYTYSA